jgi:thioesterase domain-containing protein
MLLACQAAAMLPADVPIDVLERALAVRHAIKVAILSYSLPPLPVTATLFVATEEDERNRSLAEWDALADRVIRIPMAADHMSIVKPPHAAQLGRRISEVIATSYTEQ